MASPFAELESTFQRYFYNVDIQAMRIVLGAMASHYLPCGDPAWVFIIGPPGTGKTTSMIMGARTLEQAHILSDLSENTFLSGFYGRPQPGLLEKLGPVEQRGQTFLTRGNALFLIKDFTTVLQMKRDKRAAILSQFREIHDGNYSREFGTGERKEWYGKVTIIAAVTPELDRYYSIFNTLGERFLQVRLPRPDQKAGEWAIRQQGQEETIRRQLIEAFTNLFHNLPLQLPRLSQSALQQLTEMAEFAAKARTHVSRSGFGNREIEYIPTPEANTRIAKELAAVALGIAALQRHHEVTDSELSDMQRISLDSIPELRRKLLSAVRHGKAIENLAPRTVLNRQLEELHALGLIEGEMNTAFQLTSTTLSLVKQGVPTL
jgi:hypothetical protein